MTWAAWAMLIPAWTIVTVAMIWSMGRVLKSSLSSESVPQPPVAPQGSYRAHSSEMQGAPE